MLSLFKIKGDSMLPKMAGGDFVIISRLFFSLKPGDVVVVDHPVYQRIVKRIEKTCSQQGIWLTGDNLSASVSSDDMGWVSRNQVKGKVIVTISR
jgi:nickel-type superoxide dismutase maturation protease